MNHLQKEPFFISIVIPIMNESGNIEVLLDRISASLQDLERYEIIFVDDGSTDETLSLLKQYHSHNKRIQYLSFSRNFGHQNALKAGLHFANGDCVISLDGDLQHPPELIPELIDKWLSGYDVVYTIRKEDIHLSFLKRKTSHFFYKLMNIVSDVQLEEGSADYRLMDKYVVEVIKKLDEDSLFFRGITKWIGFKQCSIEYTPAQRTWGESKYPFKKMVRFAVQGITSFSIQPLFLAIYLGFFFSFLSVLYIPYIIYTMYTNSHVPGWVSILMTVVFFGGVQLIVLGIMGVYIGKIFISQKKRPDYIIREKSDFLTEKK